MVSNPPSVSIRTTDGATLATAACIACSSLADRSSCATAEAADSAVRQHMANNLANERPVGQPSEIRWIIIVVSLFFRIGLRRRRLFLGRDFQRYFNQGPIALDRQPD